MPFDACISFQPNAWQLSRHTRMIEYVTLGLNDLKGTLSNNLGEIPSGPVAFDVSRLHEISKTSVSDHLYHVYTKQKSSSSSFFIFILMMTKD